MYIAAHPPESVYFQKDHDTLEKRSGRWLKDLARQSRAPAFDLEVWAPAREANGRKPKSFIER